MKGIFTKTIGIIVFVVFLGIIRMDLVDAASMSCFYQSNDGSAIIDVSDGWSDTAGSVIDNYKHHETRILKVRNWQTVVSLSDSKGVFDKTTYKYRDYTSYDPYTDVWNNEKCPTYVVLARQTDGYGVHHLYLSDSANVSKVKEYAEAVMSLEKNGGAVVVIPLVGTTAQGADGGQFNQSGEACICTATGSTEITGKFEIGKARSLRNVSVNLSISKNNYKRSPINWASRVATPSLSYNVVNEILRTGTCPSKMVVAAQGNKVSLFFSDAGNVNAIRSAAASHTGISTDYVYVADCEVDTSVERPVSETKPKPTWEDPSINIGAITPLTASSGIYSCGNGFMETIPSVIINAVRMIYTILQVFVPIALVLMGTIDLAKSITSQKEDDIKKGQQIFIKRLVVAAIVFFVFAFLKLAVGIFSNDTNDIVDCMNCFLKGTDFCE